MDVTTSQATKTGFYLGTALYSAPEQLQGQKVTPKSDVYSLGVTLYQAAAGEVPFVGTPMEVAGQHIHQAPVPPKDNGVGTGSFEALILDCLSKDPDLRPTAEEVHERLREETSQAREQATAAAPPAPETRPTRQARPAPTSAPVREGGQRRRRGPLLLGLAALLLVLLGIAAFAATRGNEDPGTASSPPPDSGQAEPAARNEAQAPPPAENTEPAAKPEQPQQGQQEQPQQVQQAEQPEDPPAGGGQGASGSGESGGLSKAAAEEVVRQVYTTADAGDFETSYALLSQGFQEAQGVSSPDDWSLTFDTLESVRFIEGPSAQVSGDTATVTGVTIAEITDGTTERNTGIWTLVNEGGEWKLDDLSLEQELI